jgi:AcrR family transcriptional regulator
VPRRRTNREELLDAAITVIRRDGPGASMEAIAAAAGVTKPILYRHFGHRDGLTSALAARFAEDLRARLQRALGREGGPREVLLATIDAYVGFIESDPQLYRFLVRHALRQEWDGERLSGFIRQVGADIAVVLGEQLRAAGRDSGAAEPWAYGIVGLVHMAGDWWLERRAMPRARVVTYLTDLLWSGLGPAVGPAVDTAAPIHAITHTQEAT